MNGPSAKWTAIVTTAPRPKCTLLETIENIRDCGWEPVVFAEPNSTQSDCLTFNNEHRLGVWLNWIKACRWALEQNTEYILTVQDDTSFHPESRELAEWIAWPEDAGYISLYTPKHYQFWADKKTPRKRGFYPVQTESMWGAVALCFKHETLSQLVNHPRAKSWLGVRCKNRKNWPALKQKRIANPCMIQNSDTIIGSILTKSLRKQLYYFNPSPCSHIAEFSAIGHGGNKGRRNAYKIADPSLPLLLQLFG